MKWFKNTILIIVILSFIFTKNVTLAVTENEVREQISKTNEQIAELDRQIAQYQSQIEQTSKEKDTLAKLIKELTLTRDKLLKEKQQTEKKITATSLVIEDISSNISEQEKTIYTSQKALGKMISDIYQTDSYSLIERILSKDSLSEASNEYNNIIALNEKVQEHLKEVQIQKEALVLSKSQKEGEQEKLISLKTNLSLQQQAIETSKKEKDQVLTETKNKEESYKKLLAEQQARRLAFEKELSDYENQLKYILDPKSIPKEGTVVFSWPLKNILITSLFGPRWGGTHNGVDFRAVVGTPVMAMSSGVIVGTGDTDISCKGASFGKWILIKYDNGLSSTYGHLSAISVKAGQKVKSGDIVALSGNTGYSTGPHLHVSVYASNGVSIQTFPSAACPGKQLTQPVSSPNARLDPLSYLPKTTKEMIK